MKITVEKVEPEKEEELSVKCHNPESEWVKSVTGILSDLQCIKGKADDLIFNVNLKNIYYFESVDDHSFFYTKDKVFESKLKVYEFEELTRNFMFFKASKSTVVNVKKIKCVKPSTYGKFEITLLNDYKLIVSRLYVHILKEKMGL